ncbi:MAG: flagellar biosynthesis protein FlhF [Spirochaetes bacterium GWD1_61_31]|nr:MAG: flagellar biosynthesis protein FlhF [Spirochaetes bacterium GWB1_60_80]OHD28530.1 MAG: flagellar biosynthesis protein FlhF [Spirochaetes bacterium GWC1_61_12]OHD42193.1 MAG: flagellar biosynthesis protein FlhF [Spirochaetes bacterium GWD1_61_31]OHD44523.1 MAG: flagellar biosynthesis protein FlhF [Spirochaetes bacterium GWE1_60_18]OHD59325.1 MAG: flagellar biosynthesis protein FlhF [Spirochaetes bacterium GWF1_60_12]HAP43179.1 flagellar biosynthesis protein FlhF [Spirochaetaceae bacteri
MQYLTEQGASHREVLERIRGKYGETANILTHRKLRQGGIFGLFGKEIVEITFYLKDDALRDTERRRTEVEDDKRKLLEKINQDRTLHEVLAEVRSLKEIVGDARARGPEAEHPSLEALEALLEDNDFSVAYRQELMNRVRAGFSLEELNDFLKIQDTVLEWLGDALVTKAAPPKAIRPRVIVLVGPTGVGKTTTIAKMAAIHKLGMLELPPHDVRMITIDTFRIGARQQIETYASIMQIPLSSVETAKDLYKTIAMHADTDLILVDTIGKSPKDAVRLAEMQQILEAAGSQAEVYLAIAATTKTQDLLEIFRQFEPFRYSGVVVTKMDETNRVGNVLSALAERNKQALWVTDGQRVPLDIERAHPLRFLMNLEGFRVNRPKMEHRYGEYAERG